jgi:hypothetical protein
MSRLKNDNLKKCFSLLREFVEKSQALPGKKENAFLAIDQLQKITAGNNTTPGVIFGCLGRPIADSNPG